jgi:hypothetical protein
MLFFSPNFRDDRGRRVAPCSTQPSALRAAGCSQWEIERIENILASDQPFDLIRKPTVLFICAAIIGGVLAERFISGHPVSRAGIAALSLLAVGMLVMGFYPPRGSHRRDARALLEIRRCPSCGFALDGRTPEPDLCTICAECGSAWRLPANLFANMPPHPSPAPSASGPKSRLPFTQDAEHANR